MENFGGFFNDVSLGIIFPATLFVALIVGYWGVPLIVWTALAATLLAGFSAPTWLWGVFAVVAVVFNIKPIRQMLVTSVLMKIMKGFMPSISQTERTALEAGVVWAEGELFSGKPNFNKLLQEPYPQMTKEERDFMNGPVEELCKMVDDWTVWKTKEIPTPVWDFIRKHKFLGMIIPKEYGGLGFTALAHSEVIMKITSRSTPVGVTVMVPNSLGPAELLIHYGTEEQKKKLLPRLANGDEIPCFALTEPTAGSDAGSLQAEGILFKGSDGKLYIKLTWNKRWITLAAISTILGLAFRLKDPENLLGKGPDVGITCALIPSNTPGVVLGKRHDPLGVPFYNCPTQGKDVVVSVDTIVGGIEGAGHGWKMLMECLSAGRGVSLPAQSVGGSKLAVRVVSAHGTIRKQFGMNIGRFEGVEEPLAKIGGLTYTMEAFRKFTLGALDKGIKPPVVTAIAKYHATELSRKIVNDSMDILGGAGISCGPRNTIAHYYMAAPIGITVEGANILTRTLIIFGQGALRAHPYAFKEVNAIEKGDLKGFDRAFWAHVGHVVRNLCRSIVLSVTKGRLVLSPVGGEVSRYYQKLAWTSAFFAILADFTMASLGGALKMKEKITGRFADILSWMYIGFAVLRRYEAEGRRPEDLPFVQYSMGYAFSQIQRAFDGILANFQAPLVGWIFRGPIKMWSGLNSMGERPSDKLTHKMADLLLNRPETRDMLSEGIFIPTNINEAVGRLENAYAIIKKSEIAEKKIRVAVRAGVLPKKKAHQLHDEALAKGVIDQADYKNLKASDEVRNDAIQVDSFTQEEYMSHKVETRSSNGGRDTTPGNGGSDMHLRRA